MKFWTQSLVARLTGSFLLVALVLVGLTGFAAYTSARQMLTQSVFNQLNMVAAARETELRNWLEAQRQEVVYLASLPQVRQQADQLTEHATDSVEFHLAYDAISENIQLALASKPSLREIFILSNTGGKIIYSTDSSHEGAYRLSDQYFLQGRQATFIQNVYHSPVTDEPALTISTPLIDSSGLYVGVLAAHVNVEQMDQIMSGQTGLGESGETYVIDRYNEFVYAERFGRQDFPRGVHTTGIDLAVGGAQGQGLYKNYAGVPVVGSFRWMENLDLAIIAEVHQEEAFAPVRQLNLTILGIGILISLLAAIWFFQLARRIARPVLAIQEAAVQVAAGDFTCQAPVMTHDEVGVLADTFNKMTSKLLVLYDALQTNEQHFRTLIENGSDIILVVNDSGIIQYVSPSIQRTLGWTSANWLQQSILDHIHPQDIRLVRREFFNILRKDSHPAPLTVRAQDPQGQWRVFEAIGKNLLDDPVIAGIVLTCRDVTKRELDEQALRRYNQLLEALREIDRAILEAQSPQAIAQAALIHLRNLVGCQRVSMALFDFETGQASILAVDVEHPTQIGAGLSVPIESFNIEGYLRHGRVDRVDELANLEGITELRRKLLAEGLHSLLNVPLIVQNELIGSLNMADERPGAFDEEIMEVACDMADMLATAVQQARLREQVQIYAEGLEEKVRQRTGELERKNREMETFSYSVSHDLKAPLRGIEGYSRLLEQEYADKLDDEGRSLLNTIRNAAQRMSQLIDDLLAYSRLERRAMWKSKIELSNLVRAVLAEREDDFSNRKVELIVHIPATQVSAEQEGLAQALRNLIDNALKFTQSEQPPRIEIGIRQNETAVLLFVKDNGIGFDMQYHDRIFEIFQRLHRMEDFPGTGVGLALVRKVMERIGGRAWAESAEGQGATFFLEIPK